VLWDRATAGGAIDKKTARKMVERFPKQGVRRAMLDALDQEPERIGDDLAALDVPLLLAKHDGCLGRTGEGFEDIVAAFPGARTVISLEIYSSSPAFAAALRELLARN
jgi:hypothetical protein